MTKSTSGLLEALEELIGDIPEHGAHGGPLTHVTFFYEDGDEAGHGHEVVARAHAALSKAKGGG